MRPGPFGRRGRGRENGFRCPTGRPRMTHSKTAPTRTAITIIASLFRAGCMSSGHGGEADGRRAGSATSPGGAQVHSWKRQARDRGHGSGNHGGAGFPVAGSAPRSTSCVRPAHSKPRRRPVQAGCPRAGAMPIQTTQGRLHRPAPTDRPPESTAGNTNSPRPPAGAPGKPTAAPAASPTARGGPWLPSSESPAFPVNSKRATCPPSGAHSIRRPNLTPQDHAKSIS